MLNKYFTFGIFLFISIYFIDNIVHVRFLRKAVPATSEAFIHFTKEMGVTNSLKKRKVKKVSVEITNKKNHVFVLILGESCSRNHMSLYNYARETTPKLEKRKDIFVYNNVVTSHSNTFSSIWMMFTTMNLENDQNKTNCISLMDVFHSAGFQTYWISNQIPIGIWDNDVYNLAQTSNVVVFKNIQANSSFESTLKSSFDEILINPFREALFEKQSNKFIVLHLMGNHSKYSKRYPPNFQIFTNNSSKKTTVVNEYDNSMIYTDFIVDSIFTLLYQQSIIDTNTLYSAIFLSDHGENVL
jgi:heptose-I-phosphate ethanolaminephosphotransferase